MQTWTADHRVAVGILISGEVARQGLTPAAAATKAQISTKTLERIRKGDDSVAPATVVLVASRLGLSPDAVQPPRADGEQAQLDRIEDMLRELVALLRPSETPEDIVEEVTPPPAAKPPASAPSAARRPRRARGA